MAKDVQKGKLAWGQKGGAPLLENLRYAKVHEKFTRQKVTRAEHMGRDISMSQEGKGLFNFDRFWGLDPPKMPLRWKG